MEIYLKDKETNETRQTFKNVKSWGEDYVIYDNNGYTGKIYCDTETECFTDTEEVVDEQQE